MTQAAPLAALGRLDRDLLHVFVAGPGLGEGIAVALPGAGWLLIDGCTTGLDGRGLPLEAIVNRWRAPTDDPVVAMVLTHPHEDHVGGFAEVIDALSPQCIGLLSPPGFSESGSIREKLGDPRAGRAERIRRGSERAALIAIQRWAEAQPGRQVLALHEGVTLPAGSSPVQVVARAPDEAVARLGLLPSQDANHLSVVLEIAHGTSRTVLASDLPRYFTNTTRPVRTGWDLVMSRYDFLGDHAVLKVPHHGSAAAMHPDLMPQAAGTQRAWCVTPHNRAKLPRVADLDGLPRMLERQSSVLLTAVPASKRVQAPEEHPGTVRLSQLAARMASQRTGAPFVDAAGVHVAPGNAYEPLDPLWCMAVDQHGTLVSRWRGRVAIEVIS
ncbi:MBL fold metallo-hydrolase [Chondromyces apiculatus]|uniref:Metallo-beta-lactamase domain-containing protein n=1 Tax=Chondromyces apiculatus DSM 436 TaxID=1192034 RepID=A0A017T3J3_9BACT|nr:MBL fold metallo-hydrolase [Chondromyces apiculatus]EYF03111.1 Hypothetical protein CAP_6225 [Chondromyces apiculatus DSM 436]